MKTGDYTNPYHFCRTSIFLKASRDSGLDKEEVVTAMLPSSIFLTGTSTFFPFKVYGI